MRLGLRPRRQLLTDPARRAITTIFPVVLALILLPSIAFASPPDPSWVAGFYDGADGDDIVSLVYETLATHAATSPHIGPLPRLPEVSFEDIVPRISGRHLNGGPRSPPILHSSDFASVFNSLPPPMSGRMPPSLSPRSLSSACPQVAACERLELGMGSLHVA